MSELTPCNYCSLELMKEQAKERGVNLTMTANDEWIAVSYSDKSEPSAWFMKITDHCVC